MLSWFFSATCDTTIFLIPRRTERWDAESKRSKPWITSSHWTKLSFQDLSMETVGIVDLATTVFRKTLNVLKQVVFTRSWLSDLLLRYLQGIEHLTQTKVSIGSVFHCKDGNYCHWWSHIWAWQHIGTVIMRPKKGVGWTLKQNVYCRWDSPIADEPLPLPFSTVHSERSLQ